MSLRAFHLFFIAVSVVLAAFFAAWAAGQYSAGHELIYIAVGVLSLASGLGLAVYAAKFQRKTRSL
jgi:predicted Na+-dependent transporter